MSKNKRYYTSSSDESRDELIWQIKQLERKLKKPKKHRKRRHWSSSSRSSSEERSSRYSRSSRHQKRCRHSRDRSEGPGTKGRASRPKERSDRSPHTGSKAVLHSHRSSYERSSSADLIKSKNSRQERSPSRSNMEEVNKCKDANSKEPEKPQDSPTDGSTLNSEDKAELNKELDADVLELIGKRLNPDKIRPAAQHADIEISWKEIYNTGLPKEERNSYFDKYAHAENCKFVEAPKLNSEIKASLQPPVIDRDNRLIIKQEKVSVCLAALGSLLSILLNKEEVDRLKFINVLSDSCRVLVDLQHDESLTRKSLILAKINASVRDALKETSIDEWLFGQNLDDKLKAAKILERSKKELKIPNKTTPKSRPKNSRGPSQHSTPGALRDHHQTRSGSGQYTKSKQAFQPNSQNSSHRGRKSRSHQDSPQTKTT